MRGLRPPYVLSCPHDELVSIPDDRNSACGRNHLCARLVLVGAGLNANAGAGFAPLSPFLGHAVGLSRSDGLVPDHHYGIFRRGHCACPLKPLCGRLVEVGKGLSDTSLADVEKVSGLLL